jgi:hypothetical protein
LVNPTQTLQFYFEEFADHSSGIHCFNNNNNNNNGFITAFPQRGSTSAKVYIKIYYTINRKSLRKLKTKD